MYEIDFHPVNGADGEGTSKSGDAITGRFTDDAGIPRVFVVDAGYQATGEALAAHIQNFYGTSRVDLAICTHPDADHINGMATVIDTLTVTELMVHQPRRHAGAAVSRFSNIEAIDALLRTAQRNGTTVSEPFTGVERFGGMVTILGPDEEFYTELVAEHLAETLTESKTVSLSHRLLRRMTSLLEGVLPWLPEETLTNNGVTNPRNETSAVTLLQVDGNRLLLTGDAGQRSLIRIVEEYEKRVGLFADFPLRLFQVPHHGSRRNLGPALLDRILGTPAAAYAVTSAAVSASEADPKHPSPKVTNALQRRGAVVGVTNGNVICYYEGAPPRSGWYPMTPLPPLDEGTDPDV